MKHILGSAVLGFATGALAAALLSPIARLVDKLTSFLEKRLKPYDYTLDSHFDRDFANKPGTHIIGQAS